MTDEPEAPQERRGPQLDPIEERVAVLTATVAQLQAEHDRDSLAILFLLGATAAIILIVTLERRQLMRAIEELAP